MHPGYAGYCKKCSHPFFPPFSGLPLKLEDLPETPPREIDIAVVCRECGHYGRYTNKDFRSAMVPGQFAGPVPTPFWLGTYECAHGGCRLPIEVYTPADSSETNDDVFQRIFHAEPSPRCATGHELQTEGVKELYLHTISAL